MVYPFLLDMGNLMWVSHFKDLKISAFGSVVQFFPDTNYTQLESYNLIGWLYTSFDVHFPIIQYVKSNTLKLHQMLYIPRKLFFVVKLLV